MSLQVKDLSVLFLVPDPKNKSMIRYAKRCRGAECIASLGTMAYVWRVAHMKMLEDEAADAVEVAFQSESVLRDQFIKARHKLHVKQDIAEGEAKRCCGVDGCSARVIGVDCPVCDTEVKDHANS